MLNSQVDELVRILRIAIVDLGVDAQAASQASIVLERPRDAAHGDLATNLALQLARPLRVAPRDLAQRLCAAIVERAGHLVASAQVAGPGFVNMVFTDAARQHVLVEVLVAGERFGHVARRQVVDPAPGDGDDTASTVLLEYVSANPTGPLHVGHGRQAALGDVLANVLEAQGHAVSREFYYNDAGAQIENLARSVQARLRGIATDDARFPADGYRGEYIADIARDYPGGDSENLDAIRRHAVACLRHEQDLDLQAFGVRFDRYYLESSLYTDGLVEKTVAGLIGAGKTFEQDGALWLRTTDYGDDKDRVMRKSDGSYTYFVPDVAYHVTKWQRGFRRAINIQGSDHHGTIARVRAGLQALGVGIPRGYPDYVLHKMVRVMRDGAEVKISKRAGAYVTLRDLIEWSGEGDLARGRDAVRYFLVSRKADSEFVFDVDLALSRSDENPVYYVQYAHARICSVLEQVRSRHPHDAPVTVGTPSGTQSAGPSTAQAAALVRPLVAASEVALMARLAAYPAVLESVVADLSPHHLCYYLRDLAAEFHAFYNAERVLVDDAPVRHARVALLVATRTVLRSGMALIGVAAPERM
ncbi:MAG: arginine--tRNA ligase [Lautropia sp.]